MHRSVCSCMPWRLLCPDNTRTGMFKMLTSCTEALKRSSSVRRTLACEEKASAMASRAVSDPMLAVFWLSTKSAAVH